MVLDDRLWRGPAPWVIVFLVVANLLAAWSGGALSMERDKNLLASREPADVSGTAPAPRFDRSVGEDTTAYLRHIPGGPVESTVILSGMSQMYAINEARPGDQTISEWMDDVIAPAGIRVFGMAAPNLHNQEALLLLLASIAEAPRRPAAFVYGVCFDKFRNVDLRPGYERLLRESPKLLALWRSTCAEHGETYPRACRKMAESPLAAEQATESSEGVENHLRILTGQAFPIVAERTRLNAVLQERAFLFRNWLLRITPTSKRPVLESRYVLNQEFLGLLADVARSHGVLLALYVIPLNPRAENPYIVGQYARFKTWLEAFAGERGAPFANLEGEVPTEAWGQFMGGPDFKHFKGEGHERTARAVLREFGPALESSARAQAP